MYTSYHGLTLQITGITQLSGGKAQYFGSAHSSSKDQQTPAAPAVSNTSNNLSDLLKGASHSISVAAAECAAQHLTCYTCLT